MKMHINCNRDLDAGPFIPPSLYCDYLGK